MGVGVVEAGVRSVIRLGRRRREEDKGIDGRGILFVFVCVAFCRFEVCSMVYGKCKNLWALENEFAR